MIHYHIHGKDFNMPKWAMRIAKGFIIFWICFGIASLTFATVMLVKSM